MKAVTLREPWASLVACGAKRIETRSWPTSYRGPLAIHAAKGASTQELEFALRHAEPFRTALHLGGIELVGDFPRGAIVATALLVNCVPIENERIVAGLRLIGAAAPHEEAFGDYSAGRYAWLLSDVRPLHEPIPAKGALGLWNWEPDQ